ncbi:MAG: hypothetical protein JSU69_12015 [Candidatus Zixiibacteriota bacterium]|nr:MAG: hypothetical protein JSU69_12015 [candidate division Zixibacteria bacterium]
MIDSHGPNSQKTDDSGYEKRDVSLIKVILYGVLGIIVLVIALIFIIDYFTAVKEDIVYESVLKPESAALSELQAREIEELNNYKLLDADKEIYRIPIERAKRLLADEAYREEQKSVGD